MSQRPKIAILDDYQNVALKFADWSAIQARAEVTVFNRHFKDEAEIIEALAPFEVVSIMRERTRLTRTVLEHLPNLRLIASTSWSNSAIDAGAAAEGGIQISHTDFLNYGTTELAWGLILAAMRNIPLEVNAVKEGKWQSTVGTDIKGRTLGILGLGRFGKSVARVGQAFGMNVVAWSQNLKAEDALAVGVEAVSKEDFFRRADIISIHMVLSDRSRGIVGRQELGLMKPTAWLINTSRGPLVDEDALAEALSQGRLGGAALDTFSVEPLPADHPFRRLPNVVATPHLGYVTEDTYRLFYGQTVEAITAWLEGRALPARGSALD